MWGKTLYRHWSWVNWHDSVDILYDKRDSGPMCTFMRPIIFQWNSNHAITFFFAETVVEHVPNIVFKKWAAELNNDKQWNKLGDVMELSRKQIKELSMFLKKETS